MYIKKHRYKIKRYVYTFTIYTDSYTHTYTYVGRVTIILKKRQ